MYRRIIITTIAGLAFLVSTVSAQTPNTLAQMDETLVRFVNDYAQVISPDVEQQL